MEDLVENYSITLDRKRHDKNMKRLYYLEEKVKLLSQMINGVLEVDEQ